MSGAAWSEKAESYLHVLCNVQQHRRTGSPGNREATDFFAGIVNQFGYQIDAKPFPCLDFFSGESTLQSEDDSFEQFISPYSLGCDVISELTSVESIEELEQIDCGDKLLLMHGAICAEQLMPKNFVFYNPEHHQKIIALLEQKNPTAIITSTAANPDMVGALDPFPLIIDGDFNIPNVYCSDIVGKELKRRTGDLFRLRIDAKRIEATGNNVIAFKNPDAQKKVVITAHIDTYENSPGASDNASGTVVLLLLSELLKEFEGDLGLEIAAFNGEDHYSVAGQMDYLKRHGAEFDRIELVINVDDVGYVKGKSNYSFYGCPDSVQEAAEEAFGQFSGLIPGQSWYNGDHMIFVQSGLPAIAFTAEMMPKLMATITHTALDTPDVVDPAKLVEVAKAMERLVLQL